MGGWSSSRTRGLAAGDGAFAVAYHQLDGTVVAVTPKRESNWWRNFQQPRECRVWIRGKEHIATGELVTDDDRDSLLAAYLENNELIGRMLGLDTDSTADSDQVTESRTELVLVRFGID